MTEQEKITELLGVLWDDAQRTDDGANDLLEQVKSLEYRLEDVKENCRSVHKHLYNLKEYLGLVKE